MQSSEEKSICTLSVQIANNYGMWKYFTEQKLIGWIAESIHIPSGGIPTINHIPDWTNPLITALQVAQQ